MKLTPDDVEVEKQFRQRRPAAPSHNTSRRRSFRGVSAAFAPLAHRRDYRSQTSPDSGQRILHPWWNLRINLSANQAVVFELPKLLRQHPRRDRRQPSPQLRKPTRSGLQMIQNRHLPPAAHQQQRAIRRAS
jgi:hypothetical protein